jgi:hypothetical protein
MQGLSADARLGQNYRLMQMLPNGRSCIGRGANVLKVHQLVSNRDCDTADIQEGSPEKKKRYFSSTTETGKRVRTCYLFNPFRRSSH